MANRIIWIHSFLLVVLLIVKGSSAKTFNGYRLYEVEIRTGQEINLLLYLQHHKPQIDIWVLDAMSPKKVLVPPNLTRAVEAFFRDYKVNYTIKAGDFAKYNGMRKLGSQQMDEPSILNSYASYEEVNDYLVGLSTKNFEWVRFRIVGWSVEGRPIRALTINPKKRDAIIVDAGVDGREWITVSVALYLMKKLVEDNDQYRILNEYKWVIVPLLNPDSYIYSAEEDRYWTKNRRTSGKCVGVNLDRNYAFRWELGAELYGDECHPEFRGFSAFSEPESRAMKTIMDSNTEAKMYLSLRSFGGYISYPWSHSNISVKNVAQLRSIAVSAARAIWQYSSTEYKVGSSADILRHRTTGTSMDYAYSIGIPLPFTLQIAEFAKSDFQPVPTDIDTIVKEAFVGIKELVYAMKKFPTQKPRARKGLLP